MDLEATRASNRLIIGVSGASGSVLAVRLLSHLRSLGVETHLVVTKTGDLTLGLETDYKPKDLRDLADFHYPIGDFSATIASGSFVTNGMIILPCSVRALAEIANGVTTNLLTRAADVTLKERRRLVLMVRESPLTLTHIRNMETVTLMGGVICPPQPLYYAKPDSMEKMTDQIVGRMLDLFGLSIAAAPRWTSD